MTLRICWFGIFWLAFSAYAVEKPTRANDLLYGEVLYKYNQGLSFEALSLLSVAKEKGGIKGHGDHPALIEGGLMLAYGMTRTAHAHFDRLLGEDMNADLSPEVRNQAWFYLGKVFYLENDYSASLAALSKVDADVLFESNQSLFFERRYLLAQIGLTHDASSDSRSDYSEEELELSLGENDLWSVYGLYNYALQTESEGDVNSIIAGLNGALSQLQALRELYGAGEESDALQDRIILSLGQELLRSGSYVEAVSFFHKIPYESLVADEALFYYAVAQSHLGEQGLAVSALNRLANKPLFTPWLQQVPFALAYLYEQLEDTALAVQAYKVAGDHYDEMLAEIKIQKANLNETSLLSALEIPFLNIGDETEEGYFTASQPVRLGDKTSNVDAYGRLTVRPSDFYIAKLLSTEVFQLALRDLHELYKLDDTLDIWKHRIQTFEVMLDTRAQQREEKIHGVASELEAQNAKQWKAQYERYQTAIEQALATEDPDFFMNQDQIDVAARIHRAKSVLSKLPPGDDKQTFRNKFDRMERFFKWQLADSYGVNRWAAQREIKQLGEQVAEFERRRAFLNQALANTGFQKGLESRVQGAQKRINHLRSQLKKAVQTAQHHLLTQVREELDRQTTVIIQHRLAARHAQARLTDALYQVQSALPDGEKESVEGSSPEHKSKSDEPDGVDVNGLEPRDGESQNRDTNGGKSSSLRNNGGSKKSKPNITESSDLEEAA